MTRSGPWLLAAVLVGAGLACSADPKTEETKLSKEEQQILELTNEARAKEKLPALKVNATLLKVARAHSANMAKQHRMEHVLDELNPAQRVDKAGYNYRSVAENIGAGEKGATVAALFKGWMDSKVHHDNILSPKYDEIGIGLATDDKGETYYTQVFGKERPKD
ncbi:MAG TPA: CAP domain-containing protein [Gemmataceae bacterium]|nr:CAP domain-containing protein [Gemmataceae bacterium]